MRGRRLLLPRAPVGRERCCIGTRRRWNVIGNDDVGRTEETGLARLASLRNEIRRVSRRANTLVAAAGPLGGDAYRQALAEIFNEWIADSSGRRQLVYFASAAEFGVLLEQHVDRCSATAMRSNSQLVRTLYWAVMRRWDSRRRLRASGGVHRTGLAAPPAEAPIVSAPPCADCTELSRDPRRGAGHSRLYPLSPAYRNHYSLHLVVMQREYRCCACESFWVTSCHPADPFVGWTLRKSRTPDSNPGLPQWHSDERRNF